MKTAFQTGPGFYWAATSKTIPKLPANTIRVHCARLEAYDIENNKLDDETRFELLVAQAEGKPEIATALIALHKNIEGNLPLLREIARKG